VDFLGAALLARRCSQSAAVLLTLLVLKVNQSSPSPSSGPVRLGFLPVDAARLRPAAGDPAVRAAVGGVRRGAPEGPAGAAGRGRPAAAAAAALRSPGDRGTTSGRMEHSSGRSAPRSMPPSPLQLFSRSVEGFLSPRHAGASVLSVLRGRTVLRRLCGVHPVLGPVYGLLVMGGSVWLLARLCGAVLLRTYRYTVFFRFVHMKSK